MIPPHDHERDDDLRPDPYIEVSWSGRIKKKKRRRTDRHLYQPQVERDPRPVPPRPAQTRTTRTQRSTTPSSPAARPRKKFPYTVLMVLFFFILMQAPKGLPDFLKSKPTRPPASPEITSPSVPASPSMPSEDEIDEREARFFTYNAGAWASNAPFVTSIQSITTNVEYHFELDADSDQEALYLAFEIGIINSSTEEAYFDFPTGWTQNQTDPKEERVIGCGLNPKGDHISLEEIESTLVPVDETFKIYHCVKLPDDFDPNNPGYLVIDSFDEKTWWRIPQEIFN